MNILFDMFGVIARIQTEEAKTAIVETADYDDPEKFWQAFWLLRHDYDAGLWTGPQYWTQVCTELGITCFDATTMQQLIDVEMAGWCNVDHDMVAYLYQLREAGHRLGLLSNLPLELAEIYRHQPWLEVFSSVTFSCWIKAAKPDPVAFETALDALGVSKHDVIFVDDHLPNITAARNLGIRSIQFAGKTGLITELARYGIETAPEQPTS